MRKNLQPQLSMKIFSSAVNMLVMAICILSGLCVNSAYAQTADGDGDEYKPMVEEGYEWGYFHGTVGDPTYHYEDFYYRLQFLGDSIVDGKTYKKLYLYLTDKLNPDLQRPIALMREENKRVFMYPPDYIFDSHSIYYQKDWHSLISMYDGYSCMDNMIYDFNAKIGDPFININYSFIGERLLKNEIVEFSKGSEKVYYSIPMEDPAERYDDPEYCPWLINKTVAGIGALSYDGHNGILPFPNYPWMPSTLLDAHYLMYKRKLDGTMVFVNDENAKYMEDDPTVKLSSVEDLSADGGDGVWIEDGTLRGDGWCTVSTLSGVKLYSGVAEGYRFPASGIYLIKTDTRVLKVAVTF